MTPDSKSLITAETVAAGSILRIWDTKTGKQIRAIKRDDAAISNVFFGGVTTLLVAEESGEDDASGALTTYDLRSGRLLQTRKETVCGVSENGKWIAIDRSNRKEREAIIVDLAHDRPFAKLTGQVSQVMFSPTGEWLAYESLAGDTAIVRRTAGGAAHTIHGHSAEFSMLALSPDGRWLATAGADFSVHIWNVESGQLAHAMAGQYTPSALAFNPDGRRVAVNGGSTDLESALRIWDIERRTLVAAPQIKHSLSGLAFSKDGAYLAASGGGSVEVYEERTNAQAARLDCAPGALAAAPTFSPNGRLVAANCSGVITVWSLAGAAQLFYFGEASDTNSGPVEFSPDGRYLAAASSSGGVVLYDIAARRTERPLPSADPVSALAFSVDGELLAFGVRLRAPKPTEKQPTLFVFDTHTRRPEWTSGSAQWVSALKFTREGLLVVSGNDPHKAGSLTLFERANGRAMRKLPVRVPGSAPAVISPNSEWLGVGWNSATDLWRLPSN